MVKRPRTMSLIFDMSMTYISDPHTPMAASKEAPLPQNVEHNYRDRQIISKVSESKEWWVEQKYVTALYKTSMI